MTARGAKLINGLLILFFSLIILFLVDGLLKTGAVDIEGKVSALFLLLNPIIVLAGFTFGILWNFLYLLFAIICLRVVVAVYHASYLSYLIWTYILTSLIVFLIIKSFYSKVKSYRHEFKNLNDRVNKLHTAIEENTKIKLALERKLGRFSALKTVAEELSTTLTLEEVSKFAADRMIEIIPKAEAALVYLVNEKQDLVLSSLKTKNGRMPAGETEVDIFDRWLLRYFIPLIVMDVRKDFRFGPLALEESKRDVRSLIATPLISENKILGILRLESRNPENFGPDDLRILDIFSDLVSVAVENGLLYHQMEELSKKDSLTGLFVPRYFHSQLETMINRQTFDGKFISLLMLDIDYFKEYNDRYGHIAGDLLLKQIAQKLVSHLEKGDFAVRYGGEEFVIIFIDTDLQGAIERAKSIRKEIAEQIFSLRRKETHITVSIGIATYPTDGKTKEELLHKADEWLYYAKEKGRNRIAYAGVK